MYLVTNIKNFSPVENGNVPQITYPTSLSSLGLKRKDLVSKRQAFNWP
jgi:hypothetical protein